MSNVNDPFILFGTLALPAGFTHRYNDDDMPDVAGEVPSWNDLVASDDLTDLGNSTRTPDFSASALNGHDAILFDGINHMLTKTFTLTQPVTYFLVIKQITWVSFDGIINGIGSNQCVLRQRTVTPKIQAFAGIASSEDSNLTLGNWSVLSLIFNGASSSIRVDDNTSTDSDTGTQDPGGIEIGRNATVYANIAVTEFVIYESALSSGDRDAAHDFLKDKYAL